MPHDIFQYDNRIVDKKSDEINFSISHLYLAPLENEQAKVMGI